MAAEVFDLHLALHQQRLWRAGGIRPQSYAAAPTPIAACEQFGDLSELPVLPFRLDVDWCLSQVPGSLPGRVHLYRSGIAEVEVGADRLRLHTRAPGILRILPESNVGVGERPGFLRITDSKVDASMNG